MIGCRNIPVGAVAHLEQSNYSVEEVEESVLVCTLLDGIINREIIVELSTQDGAATGIIIIFCFYLNIIKIKF